MSKPVLGANRLKKASRPMDTEFHSKAEEMKARLNKVSPSFCLAKWLQVSLHLTTGRTHSCYHPPTHLVPLSEISDNPGALHNTRHKQVQRSLMLKGERPSECSYCWRIEDTPGGHLSDRHYRSAESWAEPYFEEVLASGSGAKISPRALEVNFNHACQLKCSYCSPHLSSSWMEEVKSKGPYSLMNGKHNDLSYFQAEGLIPTKQNEDSPYVEAFWNWWPSVYPKLKVFRMTGGEPLLDPNTFRVLDYILENPNPDLLLAVTSNFSAREEIIRKFVGQASKVSNGRYVDKFQLYVSCDAVGPRAEYIRHGLDFQRMIKNLDLFMNEVTTATVTFIVTFNNLSVASWDETLQFFLELRQRYSRYTQRVFFDTPLLRYPNWQSIQILPESYQDQLRISVEKMEGLTASFESVETRFHRLLDFEVARMRRNLDWMREPLSASELNLQRGNFYKFFSEHDHRRGTDFLKTFPEMKEFWQLAKKAAGEHGLLDYLRSL